VSKQCILHHKIRLWLYRVQERVLHFWWMLPNSALGYSVSQCRCLLGQLLMP